MPIELAHQIFFRPNSVADKRGGSEKLALTLRARRHRRNFALVADDDEAAIRLLARAAN
jgi:hypothetical protein